MKQKLAALDQLELFGGRDPLMRRILAVMFTVGSLTILVKVLAFSKELLVAGRFGSSDVMDAFVSAFTIWSFLTGVIGGALPDALVPVYSKAKQRAPQIADQFAVNAIWVYVVKLVLITGVFLVLGQWLAPWFTHGYTEEKRALTVKLFYCLAPFSVFWGTSLIMTMLLQANKRFILAAAAPAAIPFCAIIGLLAGYELIGIYALILGTTAGALIQMGLVTTGFFRAHCSIPFFQFRDLRDEHMGELVRATWPYLLSGVIMGSTIVVDVGMAAGLDRGSVSVLSYAERICTIGLVLASVMVTEALYPYLSDMVAKEEWKRLKYMVSRFCVLILAISFPCVATIWWGAEWIVMVLFERNEFTHQDTLRVAGVLRWLSLQIPFNLLAVLGSRVICAMLASRFMLLTTVVNLGLNIAGNYYFARFMGVEGIALSTAVVYLISAAMLYTFFVIQIRKRIA
tara:strand:+ start:1390 stop:2757 length:1368 start_codon:yes stop_codon:yes gene_type:complete